MTSARLLLYWWIGVDAKSGEDVEYVMAANLNGQCGNGVGPIE